MLDNLTVVIPYRDGHTIMRLLNSLPAKSHYPIIIVDDVSARPCDVQGDGVRIIRKATRGYFAGAVNLGIVNCTTDVLVLNQDVYFNNDVWQTFIAANRNAGIAGDGVLNHPAWPKGYVQGTFMYLSRRAIDAVGLLNEFDFPLWGCTAEWQARAARKGFRAVPANVPGLVHTRDGAYGSSIQAALQDEPNETGRFIRTPPLVSIVVPCYNYGRYLPDLVNSLRGGKTCLGQHPGQTFTAWELLIVDDKSTDDSWQIAQGLADPWQGIHAVQMPANGGTAAAMNYGIARTYGKFIFAMDADDMLEPDALDDLYGIVSENEHAVPYHDQQLFSSAGRTMKQQGGQTVPDIWHMRAYDFNQLLERNLVPAGIMFARTGWKAAGGYREAMKWGRQDWAFAVALGQAGYCGVHVAKPLYLYRREGQNRTIRNSDPQWRATFSQQMRDLFPALYRGERPMACCGQGARRPVVAAPARGPQAQMAVMQGASMAGQTMIEYIGANLAETSWFGPSGMHYRFGPKHKIGYVLDGDVDYFLQARKGRRPEFQRYTAPKPAPVVVQGPVATLTANADQARVLQERVAAAHREIMATVGQESAFQPDDTYAQEAAAQSGKAEPELSDADREQIADTIVKMRQAGAASDEVESVRKGVIATMKARKRKAKHV